MGHNFPLGGLYFVHVNKGQNRLILQDESIPCSDGIFSTIRPLSILVPPRSSCMISDNLLDSSLFPWNLMIISASQDCHRLNDINYIQIQNSVQHYEALKCIIYHYFHLLGYQVMTEKARFQFCEIVFNCAICKDMGFPQLGSIQARLPNYLCRALPKEVQPVRENSFLSSLLVYRFYDSYYAQFLVGSMTIQGL